MTTDTADTVHAEALREDRRRYWMPDTVWTIETIKTANMARGGHFFERATMRFFNSRISQNCWTGADGVYFFSSDKLTTEPRRYTVRRFDPATGRIVTVGQFRKYLGSKSATRAAKECALFSVPDSHKVAK